MHTANPQEAVLAPQEARRLRELEDTIEEGFDSFLKIGLAFAEIRYGRLYRVTHDTFESYCQARWALSLSRCNQIARTLAVYDNIVAAIPQDAALLEGVNELMLRPLSTLSQELQPLAWELVRRIKQQPEATIVEEVVETIKTAVATGWQERERQVAQSEVNQEACSAPSPAPRTQGSRRARVAPGPQKGGGVSCQAPGLSFDFPLDESLDGSLHRLRRTLNARHLRFRVAYKLACISPLIIPSAINTGRTAASM